MQMLYNNVVMQIIKHTFTIAYILDVWINELKKN